MQINDSIKKILLTYRNFLISFFLTFLLLVITQWVFFIYNRSYFNIDSENTKNIICGNLVFIMATLSMYLGPFILFSICPILSFIKIKWDLVTKIKNICWIICSFLIIILNLIDVFWYPVTGERSSWQHVDTFLSVPNKLSFVWACLKIYWPGFIILIASIVGSCWFLNYLDKSIRNKNIKYKVGIKSSVLELVLFILVVAVCAKLIRGSNTSPLRAIYATNYVSFKNMDIVLNTPFIMIKTVGKKILHKVEFYSEEELESIFNPERSYPSLKDSTDPDAQCLKKYAPKIKNVILIQMESMGQEYVGTYNHGTSYAPFLDSLISRSISYNGWANGRGTKEAPISVIASFPNFGAARGNRSILTSSHFHIKLPSLAEEFEKLSFDTMFFYGDKNGSSYVDTFARFQGFNYYFGKKEYDIANPGNHDLLEGCSGVLDEPFLQYSLSTIDSMYNKGSKPFLSYIITSSAHLPYKIPDEYEKSLQPGPLPIHKPVRYSDVALEAFFKKASTMPWYNETLFILFADHTSRSEGGVWATESGKQAIPVIFFTPTFSSDCMIQSSKRVQQADILPTLLDMFDINTRVVTYGTSILDSKHMNLGLLDSGIAHIVNIDNYLVKCVDNCNEVEVFDVKKDPFYKNNLLNDSTLEEKEKEIISGHIRFTKAAIQQFTNRLIEGRTFGDK